MGKTAKKKVDKDKVIAVETTATPAAMRQRAKVQSKMNAPLKPTPFKGMYGNLSAKEVKAKRAELDQARLEHLATISAIPPMDATLVVEREKDDERPSVIRVKTMKVRRLS